MIKLNWFEKKFLEDVEFNKYKEYLSRHDNTAREYANHYFKPICWIGAISLLIKVNKKGE